MKSHFFGDFRPGLVPLIQVSDLNKFFAESGNRHKASGNRQAVGLETDKKMVALSSAFLSQQTLRLGVWQLSNRQSGNRQNHCHTGDRAMSMGVHNMQHTIANLRQSQTMDADTGCAVNSSPIPTHPPVYQDELV